MRELRGTSRIDRAVGSPQDVTAACEVVTKGDTDEATEDDRPGFDPVAGLGACAGDLGGGPRAISSSNSSGSVSPMTAVPAGTVTPGTEPSQFVPPNDEPYDTVFFDNPGVNPFIDTEDDALSTFALDVDTGSYTIARRFLADGFLPDKDSVRVEEYVNYFEQDYP